MKSLSEGAPGDEAARVQVSKQFYLWLDEPTEWTSKRRRLRLSGWIVAKNGPHPTALRAQLRGRSFEGRFDRHRPEVAAHVGVPDAPPWCGFTVDVQVPFGKGRLELQVARADGKWQKAYARDVRGPLRAGRAEQKYWREMDEADVRRRISFWFDRPSDWSQRVRHLHISGWCIDNLGGGIREMRARLRGETFAVNYGIMRPDVAANVQSRATALRSGFFCDAIVPPGPSTLILEARTEDGQWRRFFSHRVRGPLFWSSRGRVEAVGNYGDWIALHDRLSRTDRAQIRQQISGFTQKPFISILLPVYNSDPRWLRRAIRSVRRQLYPNWELCAVDDASTSPEVWRILQSAARSDGRIKVARRPVNGHISAASNDALAMATGEFIALLDHDDELAPTALYFAALELNRDPNLRLLYSDEDKLDPHGRRCDPYFKSDWNPDLLASQNYVSHLSFYAADLIRSVGGFRVGFEGSQDYDLTLRCSEQLATAQIRHIPHVLYHWRIAEGSTATFAAAKTFAHDAAMRAVQDHVGRGATPGRVVPHYGDYLRVIYAPPPESPLVSIIIPTRDRVSLLRQCVDSVREKTDYTNFEIIIVDNNSREAETLQYFESLSQLKNVRVLRETGDFNFSKLNNLGVAQARGEFVALLNNDLEVMAPEWLTEMISHAARPEIGAVGAKLWYPDGRLQHGGVLLGVGGIATHAHRLLRKEHGYFARARLTQNFSAVTGACMVLRKEVYQAVGGLDEINLPVAFNDVDFCLRLRERGLRVVWTPHAELIHHESASRGFEDTGAKQVRFMAEVEFMQKKWGHLLEADPFYNPNFSLATDQQFKLAFPPRAQKPWRQSRADSR